MNKSRLMMLAAGLILIASPALAVPGERPGEAVPIDDPALLESLGLAADAPNVYATEHALRRMAMTPAKRAAEDEAFLAAIEATPAGGPYGSSTGYSTLGYQAFRPVLSTPGIPSYHNSEGFRGLYCVGGTPFYDAPFESLPHGARLLGVFVYLYDDSAQDITAALYRTCQSTSVNEPQLTLLDFDSTAGTPTYIGALLIVPEGEGTIDNRQCRYWVRVHLGTATPCSGGANLSIVKARAAWQRQISPAPATATFNDVPVGHPFFQHIEALAASEITAGCGAGNFCPGASLTRGQMAAFLAKALGLHWGSF